MVFFSEPALAHIQQPFTIFKYILAFDLPDWFKYAKKVTKIQILVNLKHILIGPVPPPAIDWCPLKANQPNKGLTTILPGLVLVLNI